jgi:hypothetical protein
MKLKTTSKLAAALVAAAALTSAANAAFVEGKIDFGIVVTLDSQNLGSATKVMSWDTTFVTLVTDDYDTFANPGNPAIFTAPWTFNSGAVTPLWTAAGFSFDLSSSAVNGVQTNTFLNVVGTGTVTGNGFDPTPGTFSFTITNQGGAAGNGQFSFVASTATVPDGGTTVALLGVSLLGLHGLRRKFGK